MEGPVAPPPENPDHTADGDANQPDQNNEIMPLLVIQLHLLISLQINLLPSSHPTNLHHSSAFNNLFHNSPLHSSLFYIGLSLFCTN